MNASTTSASTVKALNTLTENITTVGYPNSVYLSFFETTFNFFKEFQNSLFQTLERHYLNYQKL